ncbi:MAG: hypothetical protein OEM02_11040, partial [Desulfobulbaceae bacterium]|nr:hypothetical protein [Desulfobulbaceae bacterium]
MVTIELIYSSPEINDARMYPAHCHGARTSLRNTTGEQEYLFTRIDDCAIHPSALPYSKEVLHNYFCYLTALKLINCPYFYSLPMTTKSSANI